MKLYKDKYYLALSLIATLTSLVLYYATKAPTVSFWDCGEFIATSYILGIPHPPGNPLFVLIGRFFTLLPIDPSLAVRVNLISVLSSAASVFAAFWLILRIVIGNRSEIPSGNARIGLGIGTFCGALIMGFSFTFWSNAVEAEVYGLSMLLMLVITYLALLWARQAGEGTSDRLLVLISYLLWLSLGVHMTTFIVAVPLVAYLGYIDYKNNGLERWPVWLILGLFVLYAVPLQTLLLSIVGIDISARELESFFVIIGIAVVVSTVMYFIARSKAAPSARSWALALLVLGFGILGYSTQAYIPIRAAEKPAINENDPSNWPRFKSFLERKQYGQESMVTRMFQRRGSWQSQFVSNPNFGLMRLLTEQYASPDAKLAFFDKKDQAEKANAGFALHLWFVYIVLFGLGGIMEAVKRSRPEGVFIVVTMLLCTVGLVLYLNFSDGVHNRMIAPLAEVRNRDYFYTPGFMYFGILISVGMAAFLEWLSRKTDPAVTASKPWPKWAFPAILIIAIMFPIHTASANYVRNNRSGNFIPWDYANNILQSCDRNSIIFTNGDNDTFPLWFLQEVEGVRKDVRVVNLSLLNTPWYIHQIKNQMEVPITLSVDEIDRLMPIRIQGYDRIWRVQDEMVKHIITNSQAGGWEMPVYFAMTVSPENKLGLDDHLVLEGMALRVVETTGTDRVNPSVGYRLFTDPSNFRGLADPEVRKDANDYRLVSNYVAAIFQAVEALEKNGQIDSAMVLVEVGVSLRPPESMWQANAYLGKLYFVAGRLDKFDTLIRDYDPETREKTLLAVAQNFIVAKNFDMAKRVLRTTLEKFPSSFAALNNLAVIYMQAGDSIAADSAVNRFRAANGNDSVLMSSVDDMLKRFSEAPSPISEVK